jgi:ribosomal protein L37AE/L43A
MFHPNSITPQAAPPSPMTECAQCGEHLFAPEWSEYVDDRRVRHLWQCEGCGYTFETTISFAKSAA